MVQSRPAALDVPYTPSLHTGGGRWAGVGGYTVVYDAPQFQFNLQRMSLRSSLTTVGSFAAALLVSLIGFVGGDNSNLWSFQPGTMLSEPTEMLIGLMQIRANHISIMCELLTDWMMTYFSLIVAASSRRRITAQSVPSSRGLFWRAVPLMIPRGCVQRGFFPHGVKHLIAGEKSMSSLIARN